jgi:hypothetical protein
MSDKRRAASEAEIAKTEIYADSASQYVKKTTLKSLERVNPRIDIGACVYVQQSYREGGAERLGA